MRDNWLKILLLFVVAMFVVPSLSAQRVIQYTAGMGTRDRENPDVWILYHKVKAIHEGMTLYTDSAAFDTKNNTFQAYGNVRIHFTDTTTLYGKFAIYDGTTRIADVWGDTVTLVDGRTVLKTDALSFDRNANSAAYYHWGHTTHDSSSLVSMMGFYYTETRDIFLYDSVVLRDSNSRLVTDTLLYNTRTSLASFTCPTYIYSDSSTVYSELGSYNTDSHVAESFKATRLANRDTWLTADTLYFNDKEEHGEAFGHVTIVDTADDVICIGNVGITDQQEHYAFVTDSALIIYISDGDSIYMHADSIWAYNNEEREFESAKAYHNVRVFRYDAQAICDSLYFSMPDSSVTLYHDPVVWYEDYQCSADTIVCRYDSSGIRLIMLRKNVMSIEKVDSLRFSQLKGNNANVYCDRSEPLYTDILGSARMVYYVIDESTEWERMPGDSVATKHVHRELLGVNSGVGSDMRIYFENRKPKRVVTYGKPDMKMYPPDQLPEDEKALPGFSWRDAIRPHSPAEVFLRSVTK